MARPIRILLVEDNEVYRSSLELMLGMQEGLEVVGGVSDGAAAAAACAATGAEVVLMDLRLPGLDGPAATAALLEVRPDAAVLCLTAEATEEDVQAMLAAGALGIVEKGDSVERLVAAIRAAVPGRAM